MIIGNTHDETLRLHFADRDWLVLEWQGRERLSEPFHFQITLLVEDHLPIKNYLGVTAQLIFQGSSLVNRELVGVITKISKLGFPASKKQRLKIIIESRLALLKQPCNARVFLNKSPLDIARKILKQHGYERIQIRVRLKNSYASKPLTIQIPNETDFDFLQRLLAKAGIYYWFLSEHGREIFCLADDKIQHKQSLNPIHILPESSLLKPEHGFFHVQVHHQVSPEKMSIRDHDTLENPENLFAAEINSKNKSAIHQDYYGLGSSDIKQSQQWANVLNEAAACESYYLTAVSNQPTLIMGETIHLDAEFFDTEYSGEYLVIEMMHSVEPDKTQSDEKHYRCYVKLIPRTQQYRSPLPKHSQLPACLIAHVESDSSDTALDKAGRYQARFGFDLSVHPYTKVLPSIPKLVCAGGINPSHQSEIGLHFPLQDNAEIMVGFLNGDPDRPMILGSLPNAMNMSPVVDLNKTQNIIQTRSGHQLLMEDKPNQEKIILSTYSGLNQFRLDATQDKHHIGLTSAEGKISWIAQDSIRQIIGGEYQQLSANDEIHSIKKNYDFISVMGDIHQQARTDIHYRAKNSIKILSRQNMACASEENFSIIGRKTIQILSKLGNLNISVDQGNLEINARHAIHIASSDVIQIGSGSSGIRISASSIELLGQPVAIAGSIAVLGQVFHHAVPKGSRLSFLKIEKFQLQKISKLFPEGSSTIKHLHWSQHWVKASEDVSAYFMVDQFNGNESGYVTIEKIYEQDGLVVNQYQLTEIPVQLTRSAGSHAILWNYSDPENEKAQAVSAKNQVIYYRFSVVIDEYSSLKKSEFMQFTTDMTIQFLNQQEEPLSEQSRVFLETSVKKELEVQIQDKSPEILQQKFPEAGKMTWKDIPCGRVKLYFQHGFSDLNHESNQSGESNYFSGEWLNQDYKNPSSFIYYDIPAHAKTALTVHYLSPTIFCNARLDAEPNDRYTRVLLTLAELRSIQANGKNVTIFLHGFNVPYGNFNKHIEDVVVKEVMLERQANRLGNKAEAILGGDATIHREVQSLKSKFTVLNQVFDEYDDALDPQYLNGKGTHEWAIEMEHNLNRAAGFDKCDYRYFTRVVHFIWQGDTTLFDFMNSVKESCRVASQLVTLMQQIHEFDPNIKIYLVAHSQGNGVALTAMEQIVTGVNDAGEITNPHLNKENILEHVFLWQASLPNNVLSQRQFSRHHYSNLSLKQKEVYLESRRQYQWFLPFAVHASKKITVLFSRNDNVVGPIPEKQPHGLDDETVNREKPFWSELVPALFLTHLGLNSVYQLASWVALPLSAFFNPKNQEEIFQTWKRKNPHHHYAETLDEQMASNPWQLRTKTLYSQLRKRLAKAKEKINEALKKTGHDSETLLVELGEMVFEHLTLFNYLLDLPLGNTMSGANFGAVMENKMLELVKRIIALLDIMLVDTPYRPRDALGWNGPDLSDPVIMKLVDQEKIILADQTKWLYSHSGIKTPSEDLMTQVYQGYIINKQRGISAFGRYPS